MASGVRGGGGGGGRGVDQLTEESATAAKLRTGKRCPKDLQTTHDCSLMPCSYVDYIESITGLPMLNLRTLI